jgi:ribonuclease Z
VSLRELVVLGTASQAPTRERNHNGYLLRWDGEGFLFDPGEGTQRQMLRAGVSAGDVTRICVTHFHGDHCLGVPGVVQRLSLDRVTHQVVAHYPASGTEFFGRLRRASAFYETADVREEPVIGDGVVARRPAWMLRAARLDHPVETFGYRLEEPDGRRMLPDRLAAAGIAGPDIGRLQRESRIEIAGRVVRLEEVSEPRPGQRFAFVMDTRLCAAVHDLARDVDLLVIESPSWTPTPTWPAPTVTSQPGRRRGWRPRPACGASCSHTSPSDTRTPTPSRRRRPAGSTARWSSRQTFCASRFLGGTRFLEPSRNPIE